MDETTKERCRRVIRGDRCRHNMVFEYCGICQAVDIVEDYKFPINGKDRETGEPITNPDGTPKNYRSYKR
jgi:hypothetical protein